MKKKIALSILFLIVLTPGLFGCGQSVPLVNTTWVLESYGESDNLKTVLEDTEITTTFDSTEEKVTGSAGCNNYFGGYKLKGNQLSIPGPIGATEMYCMEPEGAMDQEQEYLTTLQAAESYKIEGDKLRINCGEQVLIFNQK